MRISIGPESHSPWRGSRRLSSGATSLCLKLECRRHAIPRLSAISLRVVGGSLHAVASKAVQFPKNYQAARPAWHRQARRADSDAEKQSLAASSSGRSLIGQKRSQARSSWVSIYPDIHGRSYPDTPTTGMSKCITSLRMPSLSYRAIAAASP